MEHVDTKQPVANHESKIAAFLSKDKMKQKLWATSFAGIALLGLGSYIISSELHSQPDKPAQVNPITNAKYSQPRPPQSVDQARMTDSLAAGLVTSVGGGALILLSYLGLAEISFIKSQTEEPARAES